VTLLILLLQWVCNMVNDCIYSIKAQNKQAGS